MGKTFNFGSKLYFLTYKPLDFFGLYRGTFLKELFIMYIIRYTALHHAAQQGHINIVNILLEHKADANATTVVSKSSSYKLLLSVTCPNVYLFGFLSVITSSKLNLSHFPVIE